MPKDVRFGVVGLGMGMHHCRAIQNAKGATLAAVCDTDEERLKKAVDQYGCKGYVSFSEMLADKEIDAVNIVTESGLHAKMGIEAARAGKHLIVEKPVDITPARIAKLEEAVAATGVKCGCIFQSRMSNCNIMLKKAIETGKIGNVLGVHASLPWYRTDEYYSGPHGSWKGTWSLDGGGSLMNQGIHTVDLAIFLGGPVDSVAGFHGVYGHAIEAEDHTVAILRYASGAIGTLYTTTCCQPDSQQRMTIMGSKGSFSKFGDKLEWCALTNNKDQERLLSLFGANSSSNQDGISKDPMAVSADGHMLIIEDLVKAIRANREPVIPIAKAKHAVEVACAIYKSAKTGRVVKVS